MSTLAQIAASYGLEPIELAILVGMNDLRPQAELSGEQTALIVKAADDSDFFGAPQTPGRHRFR